MNTKIISAIAFKLFGIYVVVSAVIALPTIFGTFVTMRNQVAGLEASVVWPAIIAVATIAIALVAFKILWSLGDGVLINASDLGSGDDANIRALEKTLFVLLGLYFAVSAVVKVPTMAVTLWTRSHMATGITMVDYAWIVGLSAQFLIGITLIAKLDKWLVFVRSIGVR